MTEISGDTSQLNLQVCGCGRFHVTYGKITLHFEPQEFVRFANDVSSLRARVKQLANDAHVQMAANRNHTLCH